ncbi:MAG TPA: trypsin-like peptidase domain-containing protein [Candidatus Angelobacter sp.]|jgi:S1-C subfamily serine protease|nr:trypsin-like peptidase domain-containing protein [Candidatus Angelobacter sp.]
MENIWTKLASELADVSASVGKSVVGVQGTRHPSSGIVIASDAVLAASHAVRRDDEITVVTAPGQRLSARVSGRDPSTDLAVLRLEQKIDAPIARWASTENLRVGELVLALARTRRGHVVASSGVLSGLINGPMRTWRGGEIDQFIRPDLNLYPGFSGGPLVNSQGGLLGMNTAGLHRSGITVPSATVQRIAAELLEKGGVQRPYLGLAMQAVPLPESLRASLNLTASEGLLVAHVEPGSPAEKSGILLGDVLIKIADQPVADTGAVQNILRGHKAGDSVAVSLVRGGAMLALTVRLEARAA